MQENKKLLAKVSEREVEKFLIDEVKKLKGLCLKFQSPSNSGVPDRIIIMPDGKIYFIELKRPKGGKLSSLQKYWFKKLKQYKVNVVVLKNKEEVKGWLNEICTTQISR